MVESSTQFRALYLTRFAEGFGFITLITLLPSYINELDPSGFSVLGLTISAGLVVGLYTTGFTLAQTAAVVPLAWGGDRFDKRTVLLAVLGVGVLVYAAFPLVDSSGSFIAIRALQGVADSFREPASMALFADEGTETAASPPASASANSSGGPAA